MKGRFITALVIALLVVAFSGYWLYGARHPASQGPRTHGPLRLSFQATSGAQATKTQLDARALFISLNPAIHDRGVQDDKMVRIVNTGGQIITIDGFNPSSPCYRIEVKSQGKWSGLPWSYTPVPNHPTLKPGQNLDFPVIVPNGTESWRVGVVYEVLASSNNITHLIDTTLDFLRLPPRDESKRFIDFSEEIQR
jgi:hypothetical protein